MNNKHKRKTRRIANDVFRNDVPDVRDFLGVIFGETALVTRHFVLRLFQRFNKVERQAVVVELHALLKSRMYNSLFEPEEQQACIQVNMNNNVLLTCTQDDSKLVLITIY